jgi:hypothetical protein
MLRKSEKGGIPRDILGEVFFTGVIFSFLLGLLFGYIGRSTKGREMDKPWEDWEFLNLRL